ncbi:MAG: hypothetical protein PHP46_02735 [Candidatus Omnitrophica bacterium]|nr:hypothetical protein [Candidatus Omnitrophota bacterium]
MPYTATRRQHNIVGRKLAKYFAYKKAKKLCNEIHKDMLFFELKYLKSRFGHT